MAIEVARVGVWRLDLASGRVQFNEHSWDMLGLPARPEGMPLHELRALIHPDDLAQVAAAADAARTQGTVVDAQARYRHSDGSWRHLLTRRFLQRAADGRPEAILGVSLDLTERMQALQQAHQAQLAAEREALAARHEQLRVQAQRDAHAQLLARASHELRTPLNAVLGMARLLLERPDAPVDQRRRQARHVLAAGEHLLALVDDLLELSDAQAQPVRPMPVVLADWAWPAVQALQPLAQARGVHLQLRTGPGQAQGDPVLLQRALHLLLHDLMGRAAAGARLRLATRLWPDAAGLVLQLQPLALDDAALAGLLEPFSGGTADAEHPTGMRLATVNMLVQRMGGQLLARRAAADEGLAAGLLLELQLPPAAAATPDAEPPAPRPEALPVVLYIEDNPVNALIVRELVERRGGLDLRVATDGASGLASAREHPPALVLMDMQLPDMGGLDVLARLRADPRTAATPCVAVSANAVPEDIQRALQAGFMDYWTKPLDFRGFLASLDRLFGPAPPAGT
jgi:PAS domain S-box-containing protein